MKRWLVVFVVIVITTLMVWGSFRNPTLSSHHATVPTDELLAYDLTPPRSVVIGLAPKSDELRLTTWCVVGKAAPEERFDYSINIQWLSSRGTELGKNQFAFQSRVSAQPDSRDPTAWSSRLAYSADAVTDSRTLRVRIPKFSNIPPSKARLYLPIQKNDRVVFRATYPEPRLPIEIRAAHEGLSAEDRRILVENIASVSYDELPWTLQANALSAWQRRLDADGIEGKDFFVTRLLVGTGRASAGLINAQRRLWFVHRTHSLAYNLRAPVEVEITAKPGSMLTVTETASPVPRALVLGESGRASVRLGQTIGPQTIVISSTADEPLAVLLTLDEKELPNTLGNVSRLGNDLRYELLPMLRRSVYYALNETSPITVSIPEGQSSLGLRVRANAANPLGWLEARLGRERPRISLNLEPSQFEQWFDNSQATDVRNLYLELSPSIREISLYGSSTLAVAPFTFDPEVLTDRLSEPFDITLAPQQRWLYPQFDLTREVPLRPSNVTELTTSNRKFELLAQSRLVSLEPENNLPDTLLVPRGRTVQRHVLEPYQFAKDRSIPDDVVLALDRPRPFVVTESGARAGRVRIAYRLNPSNVGNELEWLLDGQRWLKEATLTQAEEREVSIPSGRHTLEVKGLSASDRALIGALPVGTDGALRRRVTYRLEPSGFLTFNFVKRAPSVRVILVLFAEHEHLFKFVWALDKGSRNAFAETFTPASKSVETLGIAAPQTWFWEAREHGLLYRHRESIVVGDDVTQGPVTLTLRSHLGTSAYVYCVLVGQSTDEPVHVQRFWTEDTRQ